MLFSSLLLLHPKFVNLSNNFKLIKPFMVFVSLTTYGGLLCGSVTHLWFHWSREQPGMMSCDGRSSALSAGFLTPSLMLSLPLLLSEPRLPWWR